MVCLLALISASVVLADANVASPAAVEPETDLLCTGYVLAGIADERQVHAFYLEWRSRPRWYGLAPYVFGSWRETGASYLGAGLLYTISLSPQWKLTASSGPGYYERDGELDLGSRLEFASTLELAYRFASGRRIALGVGHISNAGAGRINPGSEYIRLGFQFPIRDR